MKLRTALSLAVCLLALPAAQAHETAETIPVPGFRPESAVETRFLEDVGSATIAVYPTMIRRADRTAHSFPSRQQVVTFLNERGIGRAFSANRRIDRGGMRPDSQWNMFQDSLQIVGETVAGRDVEANYVVVLEILVPGDEAVFGIECYIVDQQGENAFSFLLNSHHRMFAEAGLVVADSSQAARDALTRKATDLAMEALAAQIDTARACAARAAGAEGLPMASDVVDDFEAGLAGGVDSEAIELGFSTFNGPDSTARISTTTDHPPVPGKAEKNSVLKLEVDVQSWAGVLHRYTDPSGEEWAGYDWTGARELSLWLYGNGTGTTLVLDVLDNRGPCPRGDDAERYSFRFVDDFTGWKLLSIPLEVMAHRDIGNAAPDDGFGLSSVHGWGLGVLRTDGKVTYLIDDVRLRRTPVLEDLPEGLSREGDVWVPVNELPMYGEYEKTPGQKTADEAFLQTAMATFDGDRGAAAEKFAQVGWNLYYGDDSSEAIKRFNQAWLLDPDNQHALWGFAVISRERGKLDRALRFYRMALEQGPAEPALTEEYEQLKAELQP